MTEASNGPGDLYIRGGGFGWEASDCNANSKLDCNGNVYTKTFTGKDLSEGFKIATNNWSNYNFGGPNKVNDVVPDASLRTIQNGVSFELNNDGNSSDLICNNDTSKPTTITVTYNSSGKSTITVTWSTDDKLAAPTITADDNTVTIAKTGDGEIWYTTNGDDPTLTTSTRTKYSGSFTIERGKTTTVKAAVVNGGKWSDITSKNIYVGAATDSFVLGVTAPKVRGYWIEDGNWGEASFTKDGNVWKYSFRAGYINKTDANVDSNFSGDIYFALKDSNGMYWKVTGAGIESPTNTYTNGTTTWNKDKLEAKVSGLTAGSTYVMTLTQTASGVEFNIEPDAEEVLSVSSVALCYANGGATVVDLENEGDTQWSAKYNSQNPDSKYNLKVTYKNATGTKTVTKYVAWADNTNWWLKNSENETTSPYTGDGSDKAFLIRNNGEYFIKVRFEENGIKANWLYVSIKDKGYDPTPSVETVLWSLSDNDILGLGETKYFYMSALQNDNRLSPEWELIKDEATGKYVLDNFVVIPSAEFRIRAVSKSSNGTLSYHDYGHAGDNESPYYIYSVSQDFLLPSSGTVAEDSKHSATFTMKADKGRGFRWNIGYSMVRLEFDPSETTDNLTATIDFSYPSTLKQAPKPGMPWIGLTGSALTALTGGKQTLEYASQLDSSNPAYQNAFTNAYIQWTPDGKIYMYDRNVSQTYGGQPIYYVGVKTDDAGKDNRVTRSQPKSGQVMSSTILPPRNAPQFKLTTSNGIATPPAEALTFQYIGENNTKQFTIDGKTTKQGVRYAVYEIQNVELEGMFKIFSGYGARTYGTAANGLSLFNNWGLDASDGEAYASKEITKSYVGPLSGGGPKIKNRSNGDESSDRKYDAINWGDTKDYGEEDNNAGKYFKLNNRQYVASLKLYYALDRDYDTDLHWAGDDFNNDRNYSNNGRNFSWLDVDLTAVRPIISLDKIGVNTGRAKYSINKEGREGTPEIKTFKVVLYKIGDDFKYDRKSGVPSGTYSKVIEREFDVTDQHITTFPERTYDRENLEKGTYIARIYDVVYSSDVDKLNTWNYSYPITVFAVESGTIEAAQRVTPKDGMQFYHPIIRVHPSISDVIASLPSEINKDAISATVTISNIGNATQILSVDENQIPTAAPADNGMWYEAGNPYKAATADTPEQIGTGTIHYPKGYFSNHEDTEDFILYGTRVNALTTVTLHVEVEGAVNTPADATAHPKTYMPAAVLDGRLIASKVERNVSDKYPDGFNSLSVTNSLDNEADNGYARLRFVDLNGVYCGIGSVDDGDVSVLAQITYNYTAEDGTVTSKALFNDDDLLDMRGNPDGESLYKNKRLKIGGIPYATETATDAAGEEIKVRKDQTAKFDVVLTYTTGGFAPVSTRILTTTLTYEAKELTSPRKDLADLKTKDDVRGATNDDGKTIATDVTAITESFVENYGGLFTNIEDAHVALAAVAKNDALIGYNSLDKWYMDHGDKYDDGKVNPHAPVNRRAIGHKDLTGTTTFATPAEVHPLLRDGASKVTTARDFDNTSTVNNAWWNSAASVAPAFHVRDHIKGDFVRDGKGNITGWTSESTIQKPNQHREYWAGVKYENKDAYNSVWNNGVLEVHEGFSVDVRDPKHGYYSMSTHFSKPTYTDEDATEKPLRTAFHLGEMPLNANDIVAFYGNQNDVKGVKDYLGEFQTLRGVAMPIHEQINNKISDAQYGNDGKATAVINGKTYTLDIPLTEPWNYDNVDAARTKLAFTRQSGVAGLTDESPAEKLFNTAISNDGQQHHMFFKVRHVNHESWFVPGGVPEGVLKTQPLWDAFKSVTVNGKTIDNYATAKEKDNFVMNAIRMDFDDYCPLAYDVRYTYPFLTNPAYVTAEDYANVSKAASGPIHAPAAGAINSRLNEVTEGDINSVAARDTGRVPFFGTMTASPGEIVPTAISDVNDDIRGAGFSIVYNRAAGTVTITADGDRELKDAAVYDATGASLVSGTSADRISDHIIVLDVRNISRGAYVISTNLGGAKFMK